MAVQSEVAVILQSEGIGDSLHAIPVLRKLRSRLAPGERVSLFTHCEQAFRGCPYVDSVHHVAELDERRFDRTLVLVDPANTKVSRETVDTFDFISIPAGLGQLSFREKELEYFPQETDSAATFDIVINSSAAAPSRTWSTRNWQRFVDHFVSQDYSVAAIASDAGRQSAATAIERPQLIRCADLSNRLSLDQIFYTISHASLFVTCQDDLAVLGGATDVEIAVLDTSIEWSKRAVYRKEDPYYRISYVKGGCDIYCRETRACSTFGEFRCIPSVERVIEVVQTKLAGQRWLSNLPKPPACQ